MGAEIRMQVIAPKSVISLFCNRDLFISHVQSIPLLTQDVLTTDSYMLLVDCVESFRYFWMKGLALLFREYDNDIQPVVRQIEECIKDLHVSFESAASPNHKVNILLANTGLIMAAYSMNLPNSLFQSTMERFEEGIATPNEQIKAAFILSLSFLASILSSDEKRILKIFGAIINEFESAKTDWYSVLFACGYGAARIVDLLLLNVGCNKKGLLAQFLDCFYERNTGWKSAGAGIGFSLMIKEQESFSEFLEDQMLTSMWKNSKLCLEAVSQSTKADNENLISSLWIQSLWYNKFGVMEETLDLLDRVQDRAMKLNSVHLLYHAHICLTRVELNHIHGQLLSDRMLALVDLIEKSSPFVSVALINSLRVFIGNDFTLRKNPIPVPIPINIARRLSKLISNQSIDGKIARAAGWILALILKGINGYDIGPQSLPKDPKDLKRFDSSLFLPWAFHELQSSSIDSTKYEYFLQVFTLVSTPLPHVDWSFLSCSEKHLASTFRFVANQVGQNSSKSMYQLFAYLMPLVIEIDHTSACKIGLANLLRLGGLDGMQQIISANKVLEMLDLMLMNENKKLVVEKILPHLTENDGSIVDAICRVLFRHFQLLPNSVVTQKDSELIGSFAQCIMQSKSCAEDLKRYLFTPIISDKTIWAASKFYPDPLYFHFIVECIKHTGHETAIVYSILEAKISTKDILDMMFLLANLEEKGIEGMELLIEHIVDDFSGYEHVLAKLLQVLDGDRAFLVRLAYLAKDAIPRETTNNLFAYLAKDAVPMETTNN